MVWAVLAGQISVHKRPPFNPAVIMFIYSINSGYLFSTPNTLECGKLI